MKIITCSLLASSILSLSVASAQNTNKTNLNCTNMTVTQIRKALNNNWITSEKCVKQIMKRINNISPLNTPHIVSDYQGLQTFPGLNAYVSLNQDIEQQAKAADELRASGVKKPLLGVPIAIKDTIPIVGFPTSSGNLNLRSQYTPQVTDPTIQRLIDAGAIIIGQNNMHEFGSGVTGINFSYGPIRNAHNKNRIAGGSTGGGATAVASKIAPLAIGDDLAGSLRIPSALNGVIGYRPSISRYISSSNTVYVVPYAPYPSNIAENDKMDVRGIVARSIRDVVLIDKFLSEDGGVSPQFNKSFQGVRLGVPANFYENMEPEVAKVVNKALKRLENKGAILVRTANIPNIDPATPVPGLTGPITDFKNLWASRAFIFLGGTRYWAQANNITLNPISPDTTVGMALVQQLLGSIFATQADEENYYNSILMPATANSVAGYNQYFADNNLDAVIYPTNLLEAAKIKTIVEEGGNPLTNGIFDFVYTSKAGQTGGVGGLYNQNCLLSPLLGTPSLTMPIGLTETKQLPVGMQIEGLVGGDARVLEIGAAFQKTFGIYFGKNS